MSYDLRPKNKEVDELRIGAFSWPIILQETGIGYVLGYGAGIAPASYVYQTGNHGSPASNDGYIVTAFEARAMAKAARGFVSVQRFMRKEWDSLTEEEQVRKEQTKDIYKNPWHEDRIKLVETFAEFAEKSSGFRIW